MKNKCKIKLKEIQKKGKMFNQECNQKRLKKKMKRILRIKSNINKVPLAKQVKLKIKKILPRLMLRLTTTIIIK